MTSHVSVNDRRHPRSSGGKNTVADSGETMSGMISPALPRVRTGYSGSSVVSNS